MKKLFFFPRSAALLFPVIMTIATGCARGGASSEPAPSTAPPTGPQLRAGNHTVSLRHAGRTRQYIVHVPPRATGPFPLLLAFHGGGGSAAGFQRTSGLDAVSDRNGFVVVYPNGTGPLPNQLLTFNAGDGCCGYALNNNVDDVGFAIAVIDDVSGKVSVNRRRIYATGHSNGGIMSHRLAAQRPNVFAAVAPVAGSLDLARFSPSQPVALMQIHSADDPRALYQGGLGPPFPGTGSRVQHQSVKSALDRWISANGCRNNPDTLDRKRGAAGTTNAGVTATKIVWRPCRNGTEVVHWRLTGSGHGWPGNSPPGGGEVLVGRQTNLILAAEEVWAFVSRFSR